MTSGASRPAAARCCARQWQANALLTMPRGLVWCGAVTGQTEAFNRETDMSQHTSFRAVTKIKTKRNVLKRFERVEIMKGRGKWKEGDRGLGLPKTKADA